MRVLLVEDEKKIASYIAKALQAEGFAVDVSHSGETGLLLAQTQPYSAVILDIMLPGRDGLSVLRELRQKGSTVPVLLLSARGGVDERIEGLNHGADDYLPKPFELGELVARTRALSRRGSTEARAIQIGIADLEVDTIGRVVKRGGRTLELTAREYRLLEYLLRNQGRVCGRMQILEAVWEYDFDPGTNLVDVYIRRLREKIDAEFEPKLVHSVRGLGYTIKAAAT